MNLSTLRMLPAVVLMASLCVSAHAAPPLVNYQGFLTDAGGQPLNDVMKLTFRIWNIQEGGTLADNLIWAETHNGVSVVDGRVNVILGNGTPVEADISAAQNAVSAFGEAFLGDALFIGITMNDSNNAFDPGEEISPRQQLLSVPFALNAGGNILSGFDDSALAEPADIGHVVEVEARSNKLRLALDLAPYREFVRGIYLGGGKIQVSGTAMSKRTDLQAGAPVYLSAMTKGVIVDSDAAEIVGRPYATLVGLAQSDMRSVQLNFSYVPLSDNPILEADRFPLKDPSFNEGGAWLGSYNTSDGCDGRGVEHITSTIYQIVPLPDARYRHSLIDAKGLTIVYGSTPYRDVGDRWRITIEFYDTENPSPGLPAGALGNDMLNVTIPSGTSCATRTRYTKTVCVPPGTRSLGFGLTSPFSDTIQWEDMYLEMIAVDDPLDCP